MDPINREKRQKKRKMVICALSGVLLLGGCSPAAKSQTLDATTVTGVADPNEDEKLLNAGAAVELAFSDHGYVIGNGQPAQGAYYFSAAYDQRTVEVCVRVYDSDEEAEQGYQTLYTELESEEFTVIDQKDCVQGQYDLYSKGGGYFYVVAFNTGKREVYMFYNIPDGQRERVLDVLAALGLTDN